MGYNKKTGYLLYFNSTNLNIDVNVHPQKRELRFMEENVFYLFIYNSFMDALYDKIKILKNRKSKNETNKNNKGVYRKIEKKESEYKYMYVAKNKYIFGEYRKYFIFIDAKGAYEYLLYNKILKEWKKHKRISCKPLLMPISLKLRNFFNISKKTIVFLKQFGIFISINYNKEILISKLPKSVHYYLYDDFINEILDALKKIRMVKI